MNQRVREMYSLLQRIHTVKTARVGAKRKEKSCFGSIQVLRCLKRMKKRQMWGMKSEHLFSGGTLNYVVYCEMPYCVGLEELSFAKN